VIHSLESNIYPKILSALVDCRGRFFSLEEFEARTGQNKNILLNSIKHFQELGIKIENDSKGYALISLPDVILPEILLAGLKSRVMGKEIHSFKSIGSTNEVAKRLAESGAAEGTLVIAERQIRGRGRLGRTWHSPSGQGLYFSLILRPKLSFERMPALSMVAALSVCRAIEHQTQLNAQIKWPNDCLLNGKKVAGILVEISAELDMVSYAILGIGINVNNQPRDFPSSLKSKAISLEMASSQTIDRAGLLRYFLADFERSYHNFHRYGLRFLGPELVKRSVVLGKKITINIGNKKISGTATGFDQNGALRFRDKNGVRIISAGEVSLR
jgi:BirA family transcriptional regulator, biotin operon repressor / biotin---[acetyl-CoA-carboxylase] ligase